jgi:hypothetical protein
VLAPISGESAGITDSSYCNGVAVPAVAMISMSSGCASPPVEGASEANPFASLTGIDWDDPSNTFIGCCPLPPSPVPSTGLGELGRNIML